MEGILPSGRYLFSGKERQYESQDLRASVIGSRTGGGTRGRGFSRVHSVAGKPPICFRKERGEHRAGDAGERALVAALARRCRFSAIQLHGHEPPEYAEALRSAADVRIIKAFRWRDDFSVEAANDYPADYILLDTFKKGMAGGTGETFRWREAANETRKLKKPLLLAGGISEENAEEAARTLSPFALDVSGSLEENGEKSPKKIGQPLPRPEG